jgi:hypothetical protein
MPTLDERELNVVLECCVRRFQVVLVCAENGELIAIEVTHALGLEAIDGRLKVRLLGVDENANFFALGKFANLVDANEQVAQFAYFFGCQLKIS